MRVRTNEVAPDGRMLNTPGARLIGVAVVRCAKTARQVMSDVASIVD